MTTNRGRSGGFTVRDRRALFLMALVALVSGYGASAISHTLPFARSALDIGESGMFWIFGITRAASLLGIVFAFTADRTGGRDPFLYAFALIPVGNLLTGLIPNPIVYTLAQSLTRIGVVAVAALAVVYLAEELTASHRALGIGIYAFAGSVGAGFGLLILPAAEWGPDVWRILFGLTALGLLVLPLLNKYLTESRAFVRPSTRATYQDIVSSEGGRHFWILAAISFFVAVYAAPAFDFVLERMINGLEWTSRSTVWTIVLASGLGTFGLFVGGRAADRIGRRITIVVALVIGLVGGVGFYFSTNPLLVAFCIFLGTLGASMLTPAFAAQRSELFPTRIRAGAAGLITNVAIVGAIIGFTIGALVVDSFGLSKTVAVLGIGLLVSAWLVMQLPETMGKDLVRYSSPEPAPYQPVGAGDPT